MRIFAGVSLGVGVKRQWDCRRRGNFRQFWWVHLRKL